MRRLFGTDGIRGVAGEAPLDARTAYAAGVGLARWIGSHELDREVVIGMDTRESGPWIAAALAGGLGSEGVKTRFAGRITTPGLAYVAKVGPFAAGVMVSASHNPYRDNGIKIIDHSGFKLPDEEEEKLEGHLFEWLGSGAVVRERELAEDPALDRTYLDHLAATLPRGLQGLRLVVDGANGAAASLGPELFRILGADVTTIHCSPDGRNINLHCGSQHLESLREAVLSSGADLGVAFDGDADRAMLVSKTGKVIDGDNVLLVTGLPLYRAGRLTDVIATVMSNLGLELALKKHGIGLVRTAVGDKYVLEEMLRRDAPLGGEQSGHVIFRDYATTGDGLLTALRVLNAMEQSGASLDELTADFVSCPQKLVNIRVREKLPLEDLASLQRLARECEAEFGERGRILLRYSGTEKLARVMIEGPTEDRVGHWADAMAAAIRAEIGE